MSKATHEGWGSRYPLTEKAQKGEITLNGTDKKTLGKMKGGFGGRGRKKPSENMVHKSRRTGRDLPGPSPLLRKRPSPTTERK